MDNTFVVTKQDPQIMLSGLKNIHPQVNFTFEPMVNNQMPFWTVWSLERVAIWKGRFIKNQRTQVNTFITPLNVAHKASAISAL